MEESIVELLLLDDKEAIIDKIMELHGQEILQLVYTYVKNKQLAEDLTQEIFMKCYRNLHQFNHRAKLKTWLWRIAINHCKDYLKSWYNRNMILSEDQAQSAASLKEDVENTVIQKEEDEQLARAVMELPDSYREVIYLHYYEDLSIKEISSLTKINQNTVKTRLKRAKVMLKESLEG